ncbi:hypothetical protein AYL99_11330 [Fonsecaea erecta]|uniref:Uncharacterized protein n=1 Tax=Fonsecaea erecta TaxID=1367422 RepID=A0A178Z367_9EURO|nr:hypothetical protein AYL99_11330 [Fonsecaea erecta]OAP54229.1 hypothetical protein AYL99_11330 [Fonsecaea erecta]
MSQPPNISEKAPYAFNRIDRLSGEAILNENRVNNTKISRHGLPLNSPPKDDLFDPLNCLKAQKIAILAGVCVWAFQGPLNMITIAPAFFVAAEDLNCSLKVVTD